MDTGNPIAWVTYAIFCILGLSMILALWRLVRGPSLPDRVIALDLVAYLTVGFIGTYAVATQEPAYLDAALVLALLSFLGTIALARYIERGQPTQAPVK